jgi:hypothetical protein
MSTNSTIALELDNGKIGQVYCHYDGGLEHNGRFLKENWNDASKLIQLIDHGNLISLGKDIGLQHPDRNPYIWGSDKYYDWRDQHSNWCTFFGRDKNESNVGPNWFNDLKDYYLHLQKREYNYILKNNNVWYVSFFLTENRFIQLDTAFELVNKEFPHEQY